MRRLVFLTLLLSAACASRPAVVVDRLDVSLTVQGDGSMQVEERFAVEFDSVPAMTFRRYVPVWHHDGVTDIVATMDGQDVPRGGKPGGVEIGAGPDLDVRWHFTAATGGRHVFGLRYRAAHATGLSGIRATVSWLALPAGRDFSVANASVTLLVPETAALFGDPWMVEPGWRVTRLPHGMSALRANVGVGERATAGLEFSADALNAPTPKWQSNLDLLGQFIPAFIAGALFILVVAAGVLWMIRLKYPHWRVSGEAALAIAPGDVPPAMRLAIARGRCRGDRDEIRAAIDEMVGRGVLSAGGNVVRIGRADAPRFSHEQVVLRDVQSRGGDGALVSGLVSWRSRRAIRRALIADLIAGGWADAERVQAARDLRRAGVVVVIFGLATWVAVAISMRQFGAWPLAIPWSIVISGLMFVAGAARVEILSAAGAAARVLYFARVLDGRTSA